MAPSAPQLLLLRHGIAEERSDDRPDGQRALTPAGRRRTTAVLERAVAIGLVADRLITSPLLRARQTAEIALAIGLAPALELATALEPGADPLLQLGLWLSAPPSAAAAARQISATEAVAGAEAPEASPAPRLRLALVGHEPDLGQLAARLLGAPAGSITLRKAGLALLERANHEGDPLGCGVDSGGWRLRLLLTPRALLA